MAQLFDQVIMKGLSTIIN